jgi:hypothetical protein
VVANISGTACAEASQAETPGGVISGTRTRTLSTGTLRQLNVLESLYVDATVTLDLHVREPGCMQQPTETFEDKILSNQKLYLSYFVRFPLTTSIYVGRFMPTHRVPRSGPMFMGALENALRGLGIKRGTSAFESLPLDFVHDVARSIDRKEAQFCAAQAHVPRTQSCSPC